MDLSPREQVIRDLGAAVSHATAGEIQRASQFLREARKIRIGKHDLRRRGRIAQYRGVA